MSSLSEQKKRCFRFVSLGALLHTMKRLRVKIKVLCKKGSSDTGRLDLKCLKKIKYLRQNSPPGSKAETNKSSTQTSRYRQDNECYPQKGSRHAIDFQLFAGRNNREIGSTCSDKSLTAATECCCSSTRAIKSHKLPNLC